MEALISGLEVLEVLWSCGPVVPRFSKYPLCRSDSYKKDYMEIKQIFWNKKNCFLCHIGIKQDFESKSRPLTMAPSSSRPMVGCSPPITQIGYNLPILFTNYIFPSEQCLTTIFGCLIFTLSKFDIFFESQFRVVKPFGKLSNKVILLR